MIRYAVLASVVLLACQALLAQPMGQSREEQRPSFLVYEAINRGSGDSTQSRVDVPYRIDYEYFVPVKNNDTSIHWPFVRRGEIAIDLIDSAGVSKARAISEVVIGQNSSERSQEQKQWYQGVSSFLVSPGSYTVQVEVTDLESQRNVMENQHKVKVAGFAPSKFSLSVIGFVKGEQGPRFPDTLSLQNLGGNLLFGSPGSLFLMVDPGPNHDAPIKVSWVINQVGGDKEQLHEVARDSASRVITLAHMRIDSVFTDNAVKYLVRSDSTSRFTGIVVPLPAEQLLLRFFALEVTVSLGSNEEHRTLNFRTVWPTMPFSLRDVDLALEALRFIVSPDRLDSLKDGTFDERRDHLETFWKLRDKTPGTAMNELQAEYYRRVDYAMRNFGTLRVPDGSRTDRGKIYIVYGPPTSTDRNLDPIVGFQETWVYEKLGKKFVFKDQSRSGNYVLSATTGL